MSTPATRIANWINLTCEHSEQRDGLLQDLRNIALPRFEEKEYRSQGTPPWDKTVEYKVKLEIGERVYVTEYTINGPATNDLGLFEYVKKKCKLELAHKLVEELSANE